MKITSGTLSKLAGALPRALPSALLTASLLFLAGCSSGTTPATTNTPPPTTPPPTAPPSSNAGNFSTTVFLGDSITAGVESGSLLDTAEVHSWVPLLATQANFSATLALVAPPGFPATLELQSIGPDGPVLTYASGTTTGRYNPNAQVTDLAVPGAFVNDVVNTVPVANPTTGAQQITQLVLGFPGLALGQAYSQATFAEKANPTTIFLWIGNNDVFIADSTGMPSNMTSVADFTTQYTALIAELTSKTSAHLIIANVFDVTAIPYLQPAALFLANAADSTGLSIAALNVELGIYSGDFLNPEGQAEVAAILAGSQKGPVSDAGVLTAAEIATVQARITAFNQIIAAQAKAAGATLIDTDAIIGKTAQGITIGGYTGNNAYLGGFFSLDGVHPTNTGYALIANGFIDAMNIAFKTTIPDVNLIPVAAADPLWPPNLPAETDFRTSAQVVRLPESVARSLDAVMAPENTGK